MKVHLLVKGGIYLPRNIVESMKPYVNRMLPRRRCFLPGAYGAENVQGGEIQLDPGAAT
jgi:hypothetical protein